MMGGKKPHGFTIVETMIFLAISGVLLVSAISLISGKQNETEFTQGFHSMQNQLQGIVSNVSNGLYNDKAAVKCIRNSYPSPPTPANIQVTNGSVPQGGNFGCQFVGEAIQFETTYDQYTTIPLVGDAYADANLTPLTDPTLADITAVSADATSIALPYGIIPKSTSLDGGNTWSATPSTFAYLTLADNTGASEISLYPFSSSTFTDSLAQAYSQANTAANYDLPNANPTKGIEICYDSGSNLNSGVLSFGGLSNPTNVELTLRNGQCP